MIRRSVQKTREVNGKMENYDTEEYLLLVEPPEERKRHWAYLRSGNPDFGIRTGVIVVSFTFDQTGGYLFGQLTGRNAPAFGPGFSLQAGDRAGQGLFSAPTLMSRLPTEVRFLAVLADLHGQKKSSCFNAGALEVPIDPKPPSEATVDPTLGAGRSK